MRLRITASLLICALASAMPLPFGEQSQTTINRIPVVPPPPPPPPMIDMNQTIPDLYNRFWGIQPLPYLVGTRAADGNIDLPGGVVFFPDKVYISVDSSNTLSTPNMVVIVSTQSGTLAGHNYASPVVASVVEAISENGSSLMFMPLAMMGTEAKANKVAAAYGADDPESLYDLPACIDDPATYAALTCQQRCKADLGCKYHSIFKSRRECMKSARDIFLIAQIPCLALVETVIPFFICEAAAIAIYQRMKYDCANTAQHAIDDAESEYRRCVAVCKPSTGVLQE